MSNNSLSSDPYLFDLPLFQDYVTLPPAFLAITIAFLVLNTLCFAIRIYTRAVIQKDWRPHDTPWALGFLFNVIYFAAIVIGCKSDDIGAHGSSKSLEVTDSHLGLIIAYHVFPAAEGLVKLSLCIQYYRIFWQLKWMRICVWIGATITCTYYGTIWILAIIVTHPWSGESTSQAILSSHFQRFETVLAPTSIVGALLDWYLLILPIRALMILQVPTTRKKAGAGLIFAVGFIGATASILSIYYCIQYRIFQRERSWFIGNFYLWSFLEISSIVVASSMPTINQFLVHYNLSFISPKQSWESVSRRFVPYPAGEGTLSPKG